MRRKVVIYVLAWNGLKSLIDEGPGSAAAAARLDPSGIWSDVVRSAVKSAKKRKGKRIRKSFSTRNHILAA